MGIVFVIWCFKAFKQINNNNLYLLLPNACIINHENINYDVTFITYFPLFSK